MHPLIARQLKAGRDGTRAFMHIGKTGGTSFLKAARAVMATDPARVPLQFPHDWTVPRIRAELPDVKISFVIRDPLERIVSGFMSRERAGRPQYRSPWSRDEAIAFLFFGDVRAYLDAMLDDNPRQAAAAEFAGNAIEHIRRGYDYHVPDMAGIRNWAGPIGQIEALPHFTQVMLGEAVQLPHMHTNPTPAKAVLSEYGVAEQTRLRQQFSDEYRAFDLLKRMALSSRCDRSGKRAPSHTAMPRPRRP